MKKFTYHPIITLIIALLFFCMAFVFSANHKIAYAANPPAEGFADIVEKLLPSVVNIQTTATINKNESEFENLPKNLPFSEEFWKKFREQMPRQAEAQGSGFVIDAKKGFIVTNNHVVENAVNIRVLFQNEKEVEAELVGRDPKTDLALLKIKPFQGLKAIEWADSDKARVGDWVIAIGNPLGLGGTVTAGIISARGRDIRSGPYDDYIQTDASINRGNSGGPLFDINGKVLGINTAIYSGSGGSIGIAFSIPSNLARNVIAQLAQYGETKRGWLGVFIQEVTPEIAQGLDLKKAEGALVSSVQDNSPAGKAGLEVGDVIVEFDGKKVDTQRTLPRIVAATEPNKTVTVRIIRNGKTITKKVTIGRLETVQDDRLAQTPLQQKPSEKSKGTSLKELNIKVAQLNDETRAQFNITSSVKSGLIVLELINNENATRNSFFPGMVVTQINRENVTSVNRARKVIADALKQGKNSVLVRIYLPSGEATFIGAKLHK
ncbi:MAG: Do family serine endopeptidase [Alphaproteobacteria bacterium]|nr:Do family serine endopeptidase [Alphaproteobacteria bacterium]